MRVPRISPRGQGRARRKCTARTTRTGRLVIRGPDQPEFRTIKAWEIAAYLITIQFHHRVLDLDLALGRHGAGLSEVRRRDRSGPAGSSGESLVAREERGRRNGSLGEGRGRGRREKTRRKRERGGGRRRRGRKGPARESGTGPKSVHRLGDSNLSRRMLLGKGVSARWNPLNLFGSEDGGSADSQAFQAP